MSRRLTTWLGPPRRLGRPFWLTFLGACAIVLTFEALFDSWVVEDQELPGVTQSVFNITGLYQEIVALPRHPIPRYTVVVEMDKAFAGLTEVCNEREKTARLLRSIERALPKVVVLDKYYSEHQPNPCPSDRELIGAIQDSRQKDIPVIVGRRVYFCSGA